MIRTVFAGSLIVFAVSGLATSCPAPTSQQPSGVVTGTCEDDATHISCGCDDAGHVVYVHPDTAAAEAEARHICRYLQTAGQYLQSHLPAAPG